MMRPMIANWLFQLPSLASPSPFHAQWARPVKLFLNLVQNQLYCAQYLQNKLPNLSHRSSSSAEKGNVN
jgi:hypothetical protein